MSVKSECYKNKRRRNKRHKKMCLVTIDNVALALHYAKNSGAQKRKYRQKFNRSKKNWPEELIKRNKSAINNKNMGIGSGKIIK